MFKIFVIFGLLACAYAAPKPQLFAAAASPVVAVANPGIPLATSYQNSFQVVKSVPTAYGVHALASEPVAYAAAPTLLKTHAYAASPYAYAAHAAPLAYSAYLPSVYVG